MPPTPNLSFTGLDEFANKHIVKNCKAMSSKEDPKVVWKHDDAPIIEEWVSDNEEKDVSWPKIEKKIVRPSIVKKEFVKSKQQEKTARKTVKQVEHHRQNTHSPRCNQINWNNMMSQKLGSNFKMFNKAYYVCGRVNHQNFAKKSHAGAKKNMVPRAVLMKSGLVSINTVRQNVSKPAVLVNTVRQFNAAHSKTIVNATRSMSYLSKIAHSTIKRLIHKNTTFKSININQRVNTVRGKKFNTARPKAVVNVVKGNNVNVVKASACWVWKLKTKVLDHVSKHNSASITLKKFDYIDAQSKSDQGVIDSGCSRHMTGNMSYLIDYEEIDGGYVAFGGNPKGGKITRKCTIKTGNLDFENVYFVRELKFNLFSVSQMCDKKNSVLFNDTECIVLSLNFKLIDESQVLLRVPRKNNMYSVDLKNIVPKGGLTCLFAKATSDESKLWHRRLGLVLLVKGKSSTEALVYMGFLLATKDETSGILKSLITGIENLVDHKVKVIRCYNGTEFKNREMNQFCEMKGILRQFSVLRTPQQNGVSKAVNTACYVTQSNGFVDPNSSHDDGSKPSSDDGKKVDEDPRKENECNDQEKEDNVNTALTIIFNFLRNNEDDGAEADMNNLDTTIQIEKEVYVCQPPRFEDLDFPDRVYKVKKALYGLHQAPRAYEFFPREETYIISLWINDEAEERWHFQLVKINNVEEILKKFRFTEVNIASTPMETQKPLLKDEDGEEVDVHMYCVPVLDTKNKTMVANSTNKAEYSAASSCWDKDA
ncbi:ribonuclease H-like domain-containing protein [Tanacetum coccineum]